MLKNIYELKNGNLKTTDFLVCGLEKESPWFGKCWSLGKKFSEIGPIPIEYGVEFHGRKKNCHLYDFPMTSSSFFLMSAKMFSVVKKSKAKFDQYQSIIKFPDGKIIKDYFSVNIVEEFDVIDLDKSDYSKNLEDLGLRFFRKKVLDRNNIPNDRELFRAQGDIGIFVTENFKNQMESEAITGVDFVPIELS